MFVGIAYLDYFFIAMQVAKGRINKHAMKEDTVRSDAATSAPPAVAGDASALEEKMRVGIKIRRQDDLEQQNGLSQNI